MLLNQYQAVVLGVGGVGSAALYQLARRGLKVLGIDRYAPGHGHGSSHGETRIIRQAYFEHANYVPLALRAYALWHELEQHTHKSLFAQVGLLQVGPEQGCVISGVLQSARQHGLNVEQLTRAATQQRFPEFVVPENCVGVFEPKAGYLRVETCVQAHVQASVEAGAHVALGVQAQEVQIVSNGVRILTDAGTISTEKLVIAPGPWANQLLPCLQPYLHVRRKHVYWMSTPYPHYSEQTGTPTFLFELPHGIFYGFPVRDNLGLKVAEHSGGEKLTVATATADMTPNTADFERVSAFMKQHLPNVSDKCNHAHTCYYTMSPDEHFIVDLHPDTPNIAFAAGLSGHGFKFTPVLGEALADLVLHGQSQLPIEFLQLQRLSKTGNLE